MRKEDLRGPRRGARPGGGAAGSNDDFFFFRRAGGAWRRGGAAGASTLFPSTKSSFLSTIEIYRLRVNFLGGT